jgi:transcriptional regulator with XRE-family HTH domain
MAGMLTILSTPGTHIPMRYSLLLNPYPLDAKAVKKRMIDLGLSLNRLVEVIDGVSRQTVSRYVNGRGRNPLIQQAIADAIGLPLDDILDKPKDKPKKPREAA